MSLKLHDRPSPNFDARDPTIKLHYIVLHYTGMKSCEEALQRLCDPVAKVSAHYQIDEDGTLYRLVDEKDRAWHAGKSFWSGIRDMNSASIGIELVNPGHEFGYRPFPKAQIDALIVLLKDIIARQKLDPARALLAHSDIAPGRKEDPGELFPWEELAKNGLGIWPQTRPDDRGPLSDTEAMKLLANIGYDPAAEYSLLAFQRRFDQKNLTGALQRETQARLKAVARLFSAK